jgi:hypothetical protein
MKERNTPTHDDITLEITQLCIKRAINRVFAQLRYSLRYAPNQVKENINEIRTLRKALEIINKNK